jgi:hypothetical protein
MALSVREVRESDEPALASALEERCRGRRTVAEWRWYAQRNPAGRRAFVALDGGRIVGHYAVVPRRVWVAGREAVFGEVVDAFAPRAGAGLAREPLYVRLARALAEQHASPGGDLVYYAQTTGEELRVANALLDQEIVRDQMLLVRPVTAGATAPAEVARLERFDHQARWLWDRCCGRFGAGAVREESTLNWRLLERPDARCEILCVRDAGGILRGFAALRATELAGRDAAWIVDWLVPPEEPEVGALLLEAAGAWAARERKSELCTALPEWSPWFETLQRAGFLVVPSGVSLSARCFARKFDEVWLRENWWITLADVLSV